MFTYQVLVSGSRYVLYRFPDELVDANMYFIPSGDTGIVIDPHEDEGLLAVFEQHGTKLVVIVLTHEHYDHTRGVIWLQSKIENRLFCHRACADWIASEKGNNPNTMGTILIIKDAADRGDRYNKFIISAKTYSLQADEVFDGECDLNVNKIKLRCYHTPGHSQGSAVFIWEDQYIFTGDSLIQNTPTILRLPGSDRMAFKQITKPFLKSLNKEMTAFPGHGAPFRISEAQFL